MSPIYQSIASESRAIVARLKAKNMVRVAEPEKPDSGRYYQPKSEWKCRHCGRLKRFHGWKCPCGKTSVPSHFTRLEWLPDNDFKQLAKAMSQIPPIQ